MYRAYLYLEFVFIYFALPTLFSFKWAGKSPIVIILGVFAGMIFYLARTREFPNGNFFRLTGAKPQLKRILFIFACLGTPLLFYTLFAHPQLFLAFPKNNPLIYAAVMVLYPFLSAYPQEVIFRGFLFTRYSDLIGTGPAGVVLSGLAFGYAHIIFLNPAAVLLSAVGGMLFAYTYLRSRSLALAAFEHSLYGCLIFTIGLGRFFYHGAVQI